MGHLLSTSPPSSMGCDWITSSYSQPCNNSLQAFLIVVWHKNSRKSMLLECLVISAAVLFETLWFCVIFLNRTCGLRGLRTRQPTNFLASCAGLKSSQSPWWAWRACVPGRPPNQMRSCSLAQRQSMWFVHLSCIDSRVDAGVPLPRPTSGHVLSLCPRARIDSPSTP